MADKLLFKGDKHVKHQEGNELMLVRPTRGGDTHQVVRWWDKSPGFFVNIKCAVFNVDTNTRGTLRLVVPLQGKETVSLWIMHDGDGVFTFGNDRIGVDRVGVFSQDMATFYEEYQFSKISGGATLRRTVVPLPQADTSITGAAITGDFAPTADTDESYTVGSIVGSDPGPYNYAWTVTGGTITAGVNQATCTVSWVNDGSQDLECEVGSSSATFDGNTFTVSQAIDVQESIETLISNADQTIAVTVVDDEGSNIYALDGTNQAPVTASAGDSIYFDLTDASLSGHPFSIYTDASKTTELTVGIERTADGVLFTPPIAGTFSYQCQAHAAMGGTITISA